MSVNNTQESIYNLIPDVVPAKIKASRYKSRFNDTVREETKYSKTNSKTMVRQVNVLLATTEFHLTP